MTWQLVSFALGFLCGGGVLAFYLKSNRRIRNVLKPRRTGRETEMAIQQRLSLGPYVVALGGGTGLSALLMGIKAYTRNVVAIVTVTDEGGSSGRLIRDWGVLPPGDIRNCLVALSENDSHLRTFLNFRFDRGDLEGHSLGNLMLLAATEQTGDFKNAVQLMNRLLAVRGRVLPVTTEAVTLVAELDDGSMQRGELAVASHGDRIRSIHLEPEGAQPVEEIFGAFDDADLIVLGPGSLFTSVIPNLLIPSVTEKLSSLTKPIVYVGNLMSQPGETGKLTQMDHLQWVARVLGRLPDVFVVNQTPVPDSLALRYSSRGAVPLLLSDEEEQRLASQGCQVYRAPLLHVVEGSMIRHHSGHLAEVLMRIHRHHGKGDAAS